MIESRDINAENDGFKLLGIRAREGGGSKFLRPLKANQLLTQPITINFRIPSKTT
ncbi:MAG: hypothetical protein ACI8ZM_004980 [Crocinitomix sp.]|jgi:hypothetical protein